MHTHPGDIITVYYDPVTQKQPEGRAKLLQLLVDRDDRQFWQVSFVDDEPSDQVANVFKPTGRYERWVHPPLEAS